MDAWNIHTYRVSQKRHARFSKIKNIIDLLCNDNEGEINDNINFNYFSNRASLMGNPVYLDLPSCTAEIEVYTGVTDKK